MSDLSEKNPPLPETKQPNSEVVEPEAKPTSKTKTPPAKKAPARKASVRKAPAKKASVQKAPAKKAPVKADAPSVVSTLALHELAQIGLQVRVGLTAAGKVPKAPVVGDVGYDLYAPEDIYLPYNCRRMVDTGVVVECPIPLFMAAVPRSSTGSKAGHSVRLANTLGVLDPRFRGQTDTIKIVLEREARKQEFVGRVALKRPMSQASAISQAYEAFGVPMDAESTQLVEISQEGHGVYDVFSYVKEEPVLIYKKGERFAQIVFLPASCPTLVETPLDQFDIDGRGGFGSSGK